MKILTPGRKQKGWAKEVVCTGAGNGGGGCGAKLLVEQSDVFETSSSHYDGSTERYATFCCGSCGRPTDIDRPPFAPRKELTPDERKALGLPPATET